MFSKVNFNRPSFGVVTKKAAATAINNTNEDLYNLQKVAGLVKEQNEFVTDYAITTDDKDAGFNVYTIYAINKEGMLCRPKYIDFMDFEEACNYAKDLQIKLKNKPYFDKLRKEIIDSCNING